MRVCRIYFDEFTIGIKSLNVLAITLAKLVD